MAKNWKLLISDIMLAIMAKDLKKRIKRKIYLFFISRDYTLREYLKTMPFDYLGAKKLILLMHK